MRRYKAANALTAKTTEQTVVGRPASAHKQVCTNKLTPSDVSWYLTGWEYGWRRLCVVVMVAIQWPDSSMAVPLGICRAADSAAHPKRRSAPFLSPVILFFYLYVCVSWILKGRPSFALALYSPSPPGWFSSFVRPLVQGSRLRSSPVPSDYKPRRFGAMVPGDR